MKSVVWLKVTGLTIKAIVAMGDIQSEENALVNKQNTAFGVTLE
jgi:hypothetical protein